MSFSPNGADGKAEVLTFLNPAAFASFLVPISQCYLGFVPGLASGFLVKGKGGAEATASAPGPPGLSKGAAAVS